MPQRNRFNVLARLFGRTENRVIGQLYTHALNTPLFVEPRRGEMLLGAYMNGHVEYDDRPLLASTTISTGGPFGASQPGKIAIIEVSGALASRPMPGPSGEGPTSYEELAATFDEVLEDATVSAIILRFDSPGGFCAGLFDLSDHIFESRGDKPIIAVVDDMAYSAAYALAAACDRIYVTRTGGVGSVGVVGYHIDQSKANESEGLKVTAIYAGAHKVDFSPHFPLSDAAREREQTEVDRLYDLFANSVGRYRGMKPDAVRATEALTYGGPEAIEVGFADVLGTLDDAIQDLVGKPESDEQRQAREAAAAKVAGEQAAAAAASEQQRIRGAVAAAITAAELPADVKQSLMTAAIAEADTQDRISQAREIVDACVLAKLGDRAAKYVARNVPVADVRTELLEYKAALDRATQIANTLPLTTAGSGTRVPGVWDKTIVKFGGKLK